MDRSRTGRAARGAAAPLLLVAVLLLAGAGPAAAASAAELERDARAALAKLVEGNTVARKLADSAAGILVFPTILKAGFLFGGQIGEGALLEEGRTTGYYNTVAASYGLQAGVQTFGYALFFVDAESLAQFKDSSGFEIGVGPSVVVVDEGFGRSASSTTLREGIYAFIFGQKGLMAGIGLQGSKITRIEK